MNFNKDRLKIKAVEKLISVIEITAERNVNTSMNIQTFVIFEMTILKD